MYLRSEGYEQAREYASTALDRIHELAIRPAPTNFCVWYAYNTGDIPELNRAIDILASNTKTFGERANAELYQQFFTFEREHAELRAVMHRVHETLSELLTNLGEASKGTGRYNAALTEISEGIVEEPTPNVVTKLVARLLEETGAMQRRVELLDTQFNDSSQTIRQLRENADDARHESLTDSLTGIANRKAFDLNIMDAAGHAVETGEELCLLFLDIDHFKNFNDTWGHQLGDQALCLVARTLIGNIKGRDLAARYGGEEFAVILPGTALPHAVIVANKIRHAFAVSKLVEKDTGETVGAIAVSIGVARLKPGEALGQLIGRADQALYAAKHQGRNRVVSEDALQTL